jgi:hypothetical protein
MGRDISRTRYFVKFINCELIGDGKTGDCQTGERSQRNSHSVPRIRTAEQQGATESGTRFSRVYFPWPSPAGEQWRKPASNRSTNTASLLINETALLNDDYFVWDAAPASATFSIAATASAGTIFQLSTTLAGIVFVLVTCSIRSSRMSPVRFTTGKPLYIV